MKRPLLIIFALAALFIAGAVQLFYLRIETGDAYPRFSSLRADPLGTKAYHDAIAEMPGHHVSRNFGPLTELDLHQPTTLFYLNSPITDSGDFKELTRLARQGHRIIITLAGTTSQSPPQKQAKATPQPTATPSPTPTPTPETKLTAGFASLNDLGITLQTAEKSENGPAHATRPHLEPTLPWHSKTTFEIAKDQPIQTLYERNGQAVMVEIPHGRGTIILASDTYPLSNEALFSHRAPQLLTWLIGESRNVIFNESHAGFGEQRGLLWLIRHYRLLPAMLVALLLLALFFWKEGVTILPRQEHDPETSAAHDVDPGTGFIRLLRRSVPPSRLLSTCLEAWDKSFPNHRPPTPPRGSDPVTEYNRISKSIPTHQSMR